MTEDGGAGDDGDPRQRRPFERQHAAVEQGLDQRQRLQKVFFPEGVTFDGKEFRTPLTCPYFNNFEGTSGSGERLVARTGFEPVLPT